LNLPYPEHVDRRRQRIATDRNATATRAAATMDRMKDAFFISGPPPLFHVYLSHALRAKGKKINSTLQGFYDFRKRYYSFCILIFEQTLSTMTAETEMLTRPVGPNSPSKTPRQRIDWLNINL
jgi:hypothetical protein